jgi:hypothetical protein
MKLFTGLCASLLLVFSSVGCCCMSSCVSSCDPCGRELCGGGMSGCGCGFGGCLSKLFHHRCHKCHPMYAGYGWDAYAGCGQGVSYDGCGATYAPAGCACGQPHGTSVPMPMTPPAPSAPAPIPAAIDPMGAKMSRPAVQQAAAPMAQAAHPHQVSYEEFQRLPGTVLPAPTTSAAPPMVPPVVK